MSDINITIAIPTFNRADELRLTLEGMRSLCSEGVDGWEVVVVGNCCTDSTAEVVTKAAQHFGGRLRYVEEGRQGLNYARNRAVAEARFDAIAFLDDDVNLDPGWMVAVARVMADTAAAGDEWAVIGGRALLLYPGPRPAWLSDSVEGFLSKTDCGTARRTAVPDEVFGLNMILRREWVHRVGGFRPDLDRVGSCLISGGDTDLVERIADLGGRLIYEPGACLWHRVSSNRLRRRWFWSRRFWGNRGDVRRRAAEHVSPYFLARAGWHLSRAAGRAALAVLSQGPSSRALFNESLEMSRWAGEFVGLVDCLVHRDAPPAPAPPVASPVASPLRQ